MNTATAQRDVRQFFWGLSHGIVIFAFAGAFWLILAAVSWSAAWRPTDRYPASVDGFRVTEWAALVVVAAVFIVAGAIRVRRKAAGFSRRDARPQPASFWRLLIWTKIAETLGCAGAGWLGAHFQRPDLTWPAIALVVSLDFVPFGVFFRQRRTIGTAVAGTLVALPVLVLPESVLTPPTRFLFIGIGMGIVMWGTAVYEILRADRLALLWAPRS